MAGVSKPPQCIELLPAIFAVNRSAKRYRDAAQRQYQHHNYAFATYARLQKEMLYALKDRGIVAACSQGTISPAGMTESLCCYRGSGYCFHSPLRPSDYTVETTLDDPEVEAKPRQHKEPRLKDAIYTLSQLPDTTGGFVRQERPHSWDDEEDSWDDDEEEEEEPMDDEEYYERYDEFNPR